MQHIVNILDADCAHITGHMACDAQFCALDKDDTPMLKLTLSAAALVSMSACMSGIDGGDVTRNYTGPTQCSGFTGISATYINNNAGFPTRCGPQTQSPYSTR